jgi:hypothetical protein
MLLNLSLIHSLFLDGPNSFRRLLQQFAISLGFFTQGLEFKILLGQDAPGFIEVTGGRGIWPLAQRVNGRLSFVQQSLVTLQFPLEVFVFHLEFNILKVMLVIARRALARIRCWLYLL